MIEKINDILTEWNPIGVPESIATEEYKGYVPLILKSIGSQKQLINCLEYILVNEIGVDYDPNNEIHIKDLQQVCNKIMGNISAGDLE